MAHGEDDPQVNRAIRLEVLVLLMASVAVLATDPALGSPWRGLLQLTAVIALVGSILYLGGSSGLRRSISRAVGRWWGKRRSNRWQASYYETRDDQQHFGVGLALVPPGYASPFQANPHRHSSVSCTVRHAKAVYVAAVASLGRRGCAVSFPHDFEPTGAYPPVPYGRYRVRWEVDGRVVRRRQFRIGDYGVLMEPWGKRFARRRRNAVRFLRGNEPELFG